MPQSRIPPSLIGLLGPALSDAYTHAELDSHFMTAGAGNGGLPPNVTSLHEIDRTAIQAGRRFPFATVCT